MPRRIASRGTEPVYVREKATKRTLLGCSPLLLQPWYCVPLLDLLDCPWQIRMRTPHHLPVAQQSALGTLQCKRLWVQKLNKAHDEGHIKQMPRVKPCRPTHLQLPRSRPWQTSISRRSKQNPTSDPLPKASSNVSD